MKRAFLPFISAIALSCTVLAQLPPVPMCATKFSAGNGNNNVEICISNRGNVVGFESPPGYEHIFNLTSPVGTATGKSGEGYAVCSSANPDNIFDLAEAYDVAFDQSGWRSPTILQPNGPNTLPLTVTRTTSDGVFRLAQTFTYSSSAPRSLTVTMQLKNISGSNVSNVVLSREINPHVDNTVNDLLLRTVDSILAEEGTDQPPWSNGEIVDGVGHGLGLIGLLPQYGYGSPAGNAGTHVDEAGFWGTSHDGGKHLTCGTGSSIGLVATPTAGQFINSFDGSRIWPLGDYVGWFVSSWPRMAPGQTVTAQFVYRRF